MKLIIATLIITLLMGGVGVCEEETVNWDEVEITMQWSGDCTITSPFPNPPLPTGNDGVDFTNASGDTVTLSVGEFQDMLYWLVQEYIDRTQLKPWIQRECVDFEDRPAWRPCGVACPQCGVELEMYYEDPTSLIYRLRFEYKCPSCGWIGSQPKCFSWGD